MRITLLFLAELVAVDNLVGSSCFPRDTPSTPSQEASYSEAGWGGIVRLI